MILNDNTKNSLKAIKASMKSTSHFFKKLPLRCLTGIQVRKIGDDTDNKGTSSLT